MDESRTTGTKGGLATPRSRGAVSGVLLLALGLWGALVPFVGPYFDYAYTPDTTWTWNTARLFLEVVPGAAAAVGGLTLLGAGNRLSASAGAWLGVAAGGWFVVGPLVAPLIGGLDAPGTPIGDQTSVAVEQIGFFYGLGAAMLLVAAFALGRFSVVSVKDVGLADRRREERAVADQAPEQGVDGLLAAPAWDETGVRPATRAPGTTAAAPAPDLTAGTGHHYVDLTEGRSTVRHDVEPEGTAGMREAQVAERVGRARRS